MLVERSTRFGMLIHRPADHTAVSVRDILQATVQALPPHLKQSLTWDQGSEMADNYEFTIATNVPVYLGVLAERSCCGTVEMYVIPSFVGCDHGAAEAVGGQ
ncbi:hypothetical protein SGFS_082360 [Streptomyces graminofaciens]|uniref:Transposase n=1 Tax=Streptomyces graminofaciens TaxID=68212 RepID=A0ABN5VU07_9ACTN|nr:hypothetical protein SGFS_082360 [Streptomyces graminofaciens]